MWLIALSQQYVISRPATVRNCTTWHRSTYLQTPHCATHTASCCVLLDKSASPNPCYGTKHMWWNEASKGLDTEQLMCACVPAPTEHGNSAVVMIPCGQRGFFSNTPCEVCGQIPVVTRGYISSTSCYHYTHGDISACMYTCMYNLLPRMQLI